MPPVLAARASLEPEGPFGLVLDDALEFAGVVPFPLLFCRVVDADPDAEVEFCAG